MLQQNQGCPPIFKKASSVSTASGIHSGIRNGIPVDTGASLYTIFNMGISPLLICWGCIPGLLMCKEWIHGWRQEWLVPSKMRVPQVPRPLHSHSHAYPGHHHPDSPQPYTVVDPLLMSHRHYHSCWTRPQFKQSWCQVTRGPVAKPCNGVLYGMLKPCTSPSLVLGSSSSHDDQQMEGNPQQ